LLLKIRDFLKIANKFYIFIGIHNIINIIYCNLRVRVMVFNATFNNISVISRWSVLLVEETGEHGENQ
jgi:hypothetical protein